MLGLVKVTAFNANTKLDALQSLLKWNLYAYKSDTQLNVLNIILMNKKTQNDSLFEKQQVVENIRRVIASYIKDVDDQDDVEQNVYLKMLEKKSSYREEGKMLSWISRIAANEAISLLRKKNKTKVVYIDELFDERNNLEYDVCIDKEKIVQEAFHRLQVQLADEKIDDIDNKISKDYLIEGMSRTSIRKQEHVGFKRISRVLDENREKTLKLAEKIRKELEEDTYDED